ncbi:hypothetical protein BavelB3_06790 [Bacillus velezensis]
MNTPLIEVIARAPNAAAPVPAVANALVNPITPPAATPSIGPNEPITPTILARAGEIAGSRDVNAPAIE